MRRCQDQVCCTVSFSWSSLQVIRGQVACPHSVVVPLAVCVCVFYLSSASLPTKPWPRVSCVCEGDNTYTQRSVQVLCLSEREKEVGSGLDGLTEIYFHLQRTWPVAMRSPFLLLSLLPLPLSASLLLVPLCFFVFVLGPLPLLQHIHMRRW